MTPDEKLIHSILQGGIESYYDARKLGVRSEVLFPEAAPIWDLMERMASKGRLPSLQEIHTVTGLLIPAVCPDPLDTEIFSEAIVKRGLINQLSDGISGLHDRVVKDPVAARDEIIELTKSTAWSYGEPYSVNSRNCMDELVAAYDKAACRGNKLLGLSSPWPIVDSASLGLQKGELTVVFAKRKVGKTVHFSTLLHDPVTGQELTIKQLVDQGTGSVLSWEKNKPIHIKAPSDYLDCGTKECVKINWKSGRSITAALTHPFLTPNGWIEAKDLRVGQHNASAAIVPEPTKPVPMIEEEIKFLGYMIADGGCTTSTPDYTKGAKFFELVDDMQSIVENHFGCDFNVHRGSSKTPKYSIVYGLDNPATYFLHDHGVMGKKSIHKTIPPAIFSLPNEQLALFLGRLFSGDGCVEKKGNHRMVSYSTGSKKMAEQIQHLFLRFGVQARIQIKPRKVKDDVIQDYYELLFRKETIEKFKEHIGPHVIGPKKAELDKVQFQGRSRVGWLRTEELKDQVYAEMDERPELLPAIGGMLGYDFVFQRGHVFDSKSKRTRRKLFEAFCDVYDSPLAWVLDENLFWDEIESIEPAGMHHCYDLTVPGTSCYVANDMIVHNSWMVIVWAVHIWKNDLGPGDKLLFVTMEMTPLQVLRRMACVDLKFAWDDFRGGRLTVPERKKLDDWVNARINAGPDDANIIIVGANQVRTIKDLDAVVGEHKPKGVIVDSFYILGRAAGTSIFERVLANVQGLKLDIGIKHDIPVLASTQLKGTTSADVLNADSDQAMGAKAIGDYADVTRGLFVNESLKADNKRYWRGMEAREFMAKDVEINFNFETMDFSEVREIDPDEMPGDKKDDDDDDSDSGGKKDYRKKALPPPPKPSTSSDDDDELII